MLDVDRALLDTRAASCARPENVRVDHVRDERLALGFRRLRENPSGAAEQLLAKIHDQELRRERFARVPGGTLALASAALGAGDNVEQLLPGEVLDLARSEDSVLVHVLHVHVRRLVERSERAGLTREGDVERRHDDVEVLGVHEEHSESDYRHDVEHHEYRRERFVRSVQRREPTANQVRRKCPSRVGEVGHTVRLHVRLGAAVHEQRDDYR